MYTAVCRIAEYTDCGGLAVQPLAVLPVYETRLGGYTDGSS
jgi:hypothetical protein